MLDSMPQYKGTVEGWSGSVGERPVSNSLRCPRETREEGMGGRKKNWNNCTESSLTSGTTTDQVGAWSDYASAARN